MSENFETVLFYGASDDLIEVEGSIPGCDEYNGEHGRFEVAGLTVEVNYGKNGCWAITVCQVDEGVPVTAESLSMTVRDRMDGSPGYSMCLSVLVPPGARVAVLEANS